MRLPFPQGRCPWIAGAVGATALVVLFLVSGFFRWSPLNCWCDDVDVQSGRVRHTHFLLYCQVSERLEESWVSRHAAHSGGPAEWRRVNTFSPAGRYSPHHAFHGAISQMNLMDVIDKLTPLEPAAQQRAADTILQIWQSSRTSKPADQYIQRLGEIASEARKRGDAMVRASEVPQLELKCGE